MRRMCHGLAEFVAADVDRVEHGQHRPDRDSAGEGAGPVMMGFSFAGRQGDLRPGAVPWPEVPVARVVWSAGQPGEGAAR